MAGLSFLYAYFNLYSMGGGHDVPSIDDAMMDIESCLGVLEFLARKFYIDDKSASKTHVCHSSRALGSCMPRHSAYFVSGDLQTALRS